MISIIIPTLNEEKILAKTLMQFSALKLSHEIIISDGRSNDKTLEIAKEYTTKIIIFKDQNRQTIAHGRNLGASIASGDFLVFLDADVIIQDINYFFATLLNDFKNDHELIWVTVCQKGLPEVETFIDRFFFKLINTHLFIMNNILHFGGAPGEFQIIRSDSFKYIQWFNSLLVAWEDFDLFQRLAKRGKTKINMNLYICHPVRRAHKIWWIRLISIRFINWFTTTFFNHSFHTVWKEIR